MAFPIQRLDRLSRGLISPTHYKRVSNVNQYLVDRLELEGSLVGHHGCVNCLEWNERGTVLASGSDDCNLMLWDPFTGKNILKLSTSHVANIFSVKFLSNVTEDLVVTAAADTKVCLHDLNRMECVRTFACHFGRIKRLTTTPSEPFLFWSAAEDGTVRQFDIRESIHTDSSLESRNVLVNLTKHIGPEAEAKGVAINPFRPEMLAVGGNDPFVRIYDRRQLKLHTVEQHSQRTRGPRNLLPLRLSDRNSGSSYPVYIDEASIVPVGAVRYFVPGHTFSPKTHHNHQRNIRRNTIVTSVTFSPDGNQLLANMGGDHIYLYPLNKYWPPYRCGNSVQFLGQSSDTATRHNNPVMVLSPDVEIPPTYRCSGYREVVHFADNPRLPATELLRTSASCLVASKAYVAAVRRYNELIQNFPHDPQLYAGRATALLKRNWNGDLYNAFLNCQTTMKLTEKQLSKDEGSLSSSPAEVYRIKLAHATAILLAVRCLVCLRWMEEAWNYLVRVRRLYPQFIKAPQSSPTVVVQEESQSSRTTRPCSLQSVTFEFDGTVVQSGNYTLQRCFDLLEGEIREKEAKMQVKAHKKLERRSTARRRKRCRAVHDDSFFLRDQDDQEHQSEDDEESRDRYPRPESLIAATSAGDSKLRNSCRICWCLGCFAANEADSNERVWISQTTDYTKRFVGHCNVITDIKEANFFGNDGQYIVGGSDCGSLFIWDRVTTNTVRILAADSSTVNCVQPHPSICLLASSGIDSNINLWSPRPDCDSLESKVISDHVGTAERNQRRSTADPLEIMLSNLGYRFPGLWSSSSSSDPSEYVVVSGVQQPTSVDRRSESSTATSSNVPPAEKSAGDPNRTAEVEDEHSSGETIAARCVRRARRRGRVSSIGSDLPASSSNRTKYKRTRSPSRSTEAPPDYGPAVLQPPIVARAFTHYEGEDGAGHLIARFSINHDNNDETTSSDSSLSAREDDTRTFYRNRGRLRIEISASRAHSGDNDSDTEYGSSIPCNVR